MNFLKNRTVIGVICILLALIICFAAVSYTHLNTTGKAPFSIVTRLITKQKDIMR